MWWRPQGPELQFVMLLQEVQRSTSQMVSAAVKGAMEGASSLENGSGDFLEKLIAALSSDKGSNLLTLAISVACRSSTIAWCEHQARQDAAAAEAGRPDNLQRLLSFASELHFYVLKSVIYYSQQAAIAKQRHTPPA